MRTVALIDVPSFCICGCNRPARATKHQPQQRDHRRSSSAAVVCKARQIRDLGRRCSGHGMPYDGSVSCSSADMIVLQATLLNLAWLRTMCQGVCRVYATNTRVLTVSISRQHIASARQHVPCQHFVDCFADARLSLQDMHLFLSALPCHETRDGNGGGGQQTGGKRAAAKFLAERRHHFTTATQPSPAPAPQPVTSTEAGVPSTVLHNGVMQRGRDHADEWCVSGSCGH